MWILDCLEHDVSQLLDLRMSAGDVAPPLMGQLHQPSLGIANRCADRQAELRSTTSGGAMGRSGVFIAKAAESLRAASARGR
jgi:hypothetical protein